MNGYDDDDDDDYDDDDDDDYYDYYDDFDDDDDDYDDNDILLLVRERDNGKIIRACDSELGTMYEYHKCYESGNKSFHL